MAGEVFQLRALGEELGQLLVACAGELALDPAKAPLDELVAKPQHDVPQLLRLVGDGAAIGHGLGGKALECVGRQLTEQLRHSRPGAPGGKGEVLLQYLAHGGVCHPAKVKVGLEPLGRVSVDERELEQPKLHRARLGHRVLGLLGRRLVVLRFGSLEAAFLFCKLSAHGIGGDVEAVADFLRVGVDEHRVVCFLHGIAHLLHNVDAAAVGVRVVQSAEVVEQEVKKTGRAVDQLAEGVGSVFADEAVGVVRLRDDGDADGQAAGEQVVERAQGGLLPGGVGVETEDDLLGVALEDAGVVGGEGGALRCDGILDVGQVAGDDVELAFADDDRLGFEDGALGLVEPVDHAALAEDRRLGGVDVFAALLLGGKHAAAEADHPALLVADRENKPAAKPVVMALVTGDGQAAFLEQLRVVFF